MLIVKAEYKDIPDILALQRTAYQSEAALLDNYAIPPLRQTLAEVETEFEHGLILKGVLDGKIIGSVRASSNGHTCFIGKLIVSPEHQRRGYGARLLSEIERVWTHPRYELFTSDKSINNLRLYEKMGYKSFQKKWVNPGLCFIFLEKFIHQEEGKPV